MTGQVTIQTGARLHLGLLAHRPQTGRHFGGAGLMIDSPGVRLTATPAANDEVIAPKTLIERVKNTIARYRQEVASNQQPQACRLEIQQTIPAHQGLGSGTQLALAVGQALACCAGKENISILELAQRVGRGARSALGLHGFQRGGFLVDGGKRRRGELGTLVARMEFPSAWRIVLITPPVERGLSGTDELTAFHQLPGMPEVMTNRLCRLLLMDVLPAIAEENFPAACEAIYEYGQQVGAYFEPVQGGKLASREMEELAKHLRSQGIAGVGQSSWGPTLFALQESQASAERLVQELQHDSPWENCTFHITAPRNTGAEVRLGGKP